MSLPTRSAHPQCVTLTSQAWPDWPLRPVGSPAHRSDGTMRVDFRQVGGARALQIPAQPAWLWSRDRRRGSRSTLGRRLLCCARAPPNSAEIHTRGWDMTLQSYTELNIPTQSIAHLRSMISKAKKCVSLLPQATSRRVGFSWCRNLAKCVALQTFGSRMGHSTSSGTKNDHFEPHSLRFLRKFVRPFIYVWKAKRQFFVKMWRHISEIHVIKYWLKQGTLPSLKRHNFESVWDIATRQSLKWRKYIRLLLKDKNNDFIN